MLVLPASMMLMDLAGCAAKLPDGKADLGLIIATDKREAASLDTFLKALAIQRHPEREKYF
jgi:hypothetical protein